MDIDTVTAPTDHQTASPGWYPDPSNRGARRWWDGTQWAPSPPAAGAAATPGSNRAGALVVVAVTVAVAVIAGSWTLWHRPTMHLNVTDAVAALPSDGQVADILGDGMHIERKAIAATADESSAAKSGCAAGVVKPPTLGQQGGADLEATGSGPKRSLSVTSYVFDTPVHAAAKADGVAANTRTISDCMRVSNRSWRITVNDSADGGTVMRIQDSNSTAIIAVTRVENVVLSVSAAGDLDTDTTQRLLDIVRADIADPPGR